MSDSVELLFVKFGNKNCEMVEATFKCCSFRSKKLVGGSEAVSL